MNAQHVMVWEQFVLENREKLNWSSISKNPNLRLEFVENNPQLPWNYFEMGAETSLFSWEYIRDNQNKFYMPSIPMSPAITWDIIQDNWELCDTVWFHTPLYISQNPNLTWEIVEQNPHLHWDMHSLTEHPMVTIDIFEQFEYKYYQTFSHNPNITMDYVLNQIELDWDWYAISKNVATLDDVMLHPELPWKWSCLSQNPNITFEMIQDNPDLTWNWECVSKNPNITMQIIDEHPEFQWDYWFGVSSNPNLTIQYIQQHNDKDWNWDMYGISANPLS